MTFETTKLYQAILGNDIQEVLEAVSETDIHLRDIDGQSYLHLAVEYGSNLDIIRSLIPHLDISVRNAYGDTFYDEMVFKNQPEVSETRSTIEGYIAEMARQGDQKRIHHLFMMGWELWPMINENDIAGSKEETMQFMNSIPDIQELVNELHSAVFNGQLNILKELLDRGDNRFIMARDHTGLTILHKAVIFENDDITKYLLKTLPDIVNTTDNMNRTSLHYAAGISGDNDIYGALVKAGAVEIKDIAGNTPNTYREYQDLLPIKDAQRHITNIVKKYTSSQQRSSSTTSLSDIAEKDSRLKTLQRHKSRSSSITSESSSKIRHKSDSQVVYFEETKLYEAIIMNDVEEVEFLFNDGEDFAVRSTDGWTYLHLAVIYNVHPDILKYLLVSVDITVRDADGNTAMDLAILKNAPQDIQETILNHVMKMVQADERQKMQGLLENGWNLWPSEATDAIHTSKKNAASIYEVSQRMQEKLARLQQAVIADDSAAVTRSLDSVLDISFRDKTGLTILHKVSMYNRPRILEHLLANYSVTSEILNCRDNMDRTALHLASSASHDYIYKRLLSAGANPKLADLRGFTPEDYKNNTGLLFLEDIRKQTQKLSVLPALMPEIWKPGAMRKPKPGAVRKLQHQISEIRIEVATPEEKETKAAQEPKTEAMSKLFEAIKDSNSLDVKNLLNAGEDASIRHADGKSLLHAAVVYNTSIDILKALLDKVDITLRDEDFKMAIDLIFTGDYPEAGAEAFKSYVKTLMVSGDFTKLEQLLVDGWQFWPDVEKKTEEMIDFMQLVIDYKSKLNEIQKAIEEGDLRKFRNVLDRKKLIEAKDRTGLPPLQKAVIFNQPHIVEEIIKKYPDTINVRDSIGRTAFHYAGGATDAGFIYLILKDAGGDEFMTDKKGHAPSAYLERPDLLPVMEIRQKVLDLLEKPLQTSKSRPSSRSPSKQGSKPSTPHSRFQGEPFRMYISPDMYEKKNVPPPSTLDGKYIAQHLGSALTMALAEIAEKRPWDPVEYLAQWLIKHKGNLDYVQRQKDLLQQIHDEENERERDIEMRKQRKQEEKKIREEEKRKQKEAAEEEKRRKEMEELQHKTKEAALAHKPNLETVTEELEEDTSAKERDENGQTELHKLAGQQGADLTAVINLGYSLADRNGDNKTPRDIADNAGIQENVEALDNYITNMIENENYDGLQQLILEGYDHLTAILQKISTDGLSEDINDYIQSIPDYQEKIADAFKAASNGGIRSMKQAIDRKKLAQAKDVYGRSLMHIAVLHENKDAVEYLAKTYPSTIRARDNMNRTPFHYANAVSEEMTSLLAERGADKKAKDVKKRTPDYYKSDKTEILQMKDATNSTETSRDADATGDSGNAEDGEN